MKNSIFVIISAIAFGTYSMPYAKIAKWNLSLPILLIGGSILYMLYMSFVEKVNYFQAPPYSAKEITPYLVGTIVIYTIGFITFGKLLAGPENKVQLFNASCTALIPVFALVVPALIKREVISLNQFLGIILVVGGVFFMNKK